MAQRRRLKKLPMFQSIIEQLSIYIPNRRKQVRLANNLKIMDFERELKAKLPYNLDKLIKRRHIEGTMLTSALINLYQPTQSPRNR
jgi:hypothetical protein